MTAYLQILNNISADIRQIHLTSVKDLENLVTAFPYYSYGHMLLAKKYKIINSPRFESQLAKAAAYANSREELHQLMHTIIPIIGAEKIVESQPKPKVVRKAKTAVPKIKVAKPKAIKTTNTSLKENTTKKVKAVTPTKIKSLVKKTEVDKVKPKGEKLAKTKKPISKPTKTAAKTKVVKLKPKKEKIAKNENTFSGWLSDFNTEAKKKPKKTQKVKEAKPNFNKFASDIDDINSFMQRQNKKENTKSKLDNIIETNASAYKLDEDLVTETYAKLLTKQGQYANAIKSYELLQLKYPKKSGYFAGQIKKLKKK